MEDRLLFLIGSPRSGSTLLARMLGAHSQILGVPEPHLLTPLAFLGYFDRVEKAPYDPVISQEAKSVGIVIACTSWVSRRTAHG